MTDIMNNKIKHLEFIQGVINRLSQNSFLLKGWSVLLVSALFAVAASRGNQWLVVVAYLPAVVYWGLDGYFLRQERLFRKLYDYVRVLGEDTIDFAMDTSVVEDQVESWWKVTWSETLRWFHGAVVAVITISVIIILAG